jgi:D-glycero-alpha-D-manno-heptose 1-phosphate guanylyltransferase
MLRWHQRLHASLTVALRRVQDVSRYGAVHVSSEGFIDEFSDKGRQGPGLINGGIYVIDKSVFDVKDFPARFSFEHDVLETELARVRPTSIISDAYFVDIGIPADLERARRELTDQPG